VRPILITGATGSVRALTRDPSLANLPDGVDVRRGDLTVPETLDACLDPVDAVFRDWVVDNVDEFKL
jgi:uncharacterized protein YbjT (DUF2867 family)